jgi:2'-5' RNA ligase
MPNHRLFLAIKLPQELLAQLHSYQEQLNPQIFQIVEEDKLHLTLIFLGYVEEEKIKQIQDITLEMTQNFQPQSIQFLETGYGPASPAGGPACAGRSNPKFPRLIWLEGFLHQGLEQLKKVLEKELRDKAKIILEKENRSFLPHITLARIKTHLSNNLPSETKINAKINFCFSPSSLWLMESHLKRTGAEYTDLAEFRFKDYLKNKLLK